MSDSLRHECGIALVRLTKDLKWYQEKYGTPLHGFNQLFLLMEKQHNRGQDGAGIGCVKIGAENGEAFLFRDREIGAQGLTQIFTRQIKTYSDKMREGVIVPEFPETVKRHFDFGGELLLGHLRYGTSGNFDSVSCHPYARKSIWPTRNLLVAGNFNLTNTSELNSSLTERGAHVIYSTDTQSILEEIGFWLDEEHDRLFKAFKDQGLEGTAVQSEISKHMDIGNVLRKAAKNWDGGYAIAGLIGNGDSFVIRDPNGIRPCWYARTEDLIAVASERVAVADGTVGDVVDVRSHLHAVLLLRDERAQLDVFVGDLLAARPTTQHEFVDEGLVEFPGALGVDELIADLRAATLSEFFHQAVPGDFRRVRDVGEDCVIVVVANLCDNVVGEGGAEGFALGVDFRVVAAREVDALEGAGAGLAGGVEGFDRMTAVGLHDQCRARRQLMHVFLIHSDDGH